ncbi:hypothetical protein ACJX0J_011807, partial [Zea mays]
LKKLEMEKYKTKESKHTFQEEDINIIEVLDNDEESESDGFTENPDPKKKCQRQLKLIFILKESDSPMELNCCLWSYLIFAREILTPLLLVNTSYHELHEIHFHSDPTLVKLDRIFVAAICNLQFPRFVPKYAIIFVLSGTIIRVTNSTSCMVLGVSQGFLFLPIHMNILVASLAHSLGVGCCGVIIV